MPKKSNVHHGKPWPGAKVYMPEEAHRLVRLIAASEDISRSQVMMTIITNYFAGVDPSYLVQKFKALPPEPVLKPPPRRPSQPTSQVRIGHQTQRTAPQKVSLSRLVAEDEREA